ncbi:16S rRNA (guanine(527)-N(7))-methyltransferase RsmG [bacterium]|nr:16S rRNA (guanine(527)-N(7))-methyltransferase RsmG [bacterium]
MQRNEVFNKYQELFLEKNHFLNLISKNDEKYLYEKHIFDSLSIKHFFEKYPNNYKTLLDIGTGGGFPALPIAIEYPEISVVGIDSIAKKINAITDIAKELNLKNFIAICDRVENIKNKKFDIITSRAVAKIDIIVKYAMPLLNKGGYLIIYKAKNVQDEIKSAEFSLKKNKAKVVDIIEYQLPTEEVYERNLVIISHV